MSAAEDAYRAAEAAIVDAAKANSRGLNFGGEEYRSLNSIPPSVTLLTSLHALMLDDTQVSDLSPLRSLENLQELFLINTPVVDLSPLQGLENLEVLNCRNTPVSDLTPLDGLGSLHTLILDRTNVVDLSAAPKISGLNNLSLAGTQVDDIAPLQGVRSLMGLWLDRTKVTNLMPIRHAMGLLEGARSGEHVGLHIKGCAAALNDPNGLGRLAEIEDDEERTGAILDYLNALPEDWTPAGEAGTEDIPAPAQDEVLRVFPNPDENGRFDVEPAHPSADEISESLKQTLYHRLHRRLEDLAAATGNRHFRITRRVREIITTLPGDFAEADQVGIYLELDWIRGLYERRDVVGEDGQLPEAAVSAMHDINTLGPGLVLDNPQVEKLEERRRRFADQDVGPEVLASQDELSRSIANAIDVFGPTLRGYEEALTGTATDASPRKTVVQRILNRNTLIAVGLYFADAALGGSVGNAASNWLASHASTILTAAATNGEMFMLWFRPIVQQAQEMAAAAQSTGLTGQNPPRRAP